MNEIKKVIQVAGAPSSNINPNTSYQELGYADNLTIDVIDSMKALSQNILFDVEEISKNFNTLKNKYEEFTYFNSSIQLACANLNNSAQEIEKKVNSVLTLLITIVQNLSKEDAKFLDDIASLNNILVKDYANSSSPSLDAGNVDTSVPNGGTISGEVSEIASNGASVSDSTINEQANPSQFLNENEKISPETQGETVPPQTGQIAGSLSPGTMENTYAAQPYNLSDDEYKELCATVYAEAVEGSPYTVSDTMGVTSAVLNRVESGNWGGNTVMDVISAKGQFSGYGYQNRKFAAAMNNPNIIPSEMREAIDRTLAGERNTIGFSFSGKGIYNSFR